MFETDENGVLIGYHDISGGTRVVIPDGVRAVGAHAFRGADGIEELVIPDGVEEIGANAFECMEDLKSAVIADSVKKLGGGAFRECRKLRGVRLSAGLDDIPAWTFCGCSSLVSVEIPDGVKSIRACAFLGCTSLTQIGLPDSLTAIGGKAFMDASSLESIVIPDGVKTIALGTFVRSGLRRVHLRGLDFVLYPDGVSDYPENEFFFSGRFAEGLERGELVTEGVLKLVLFSAALAMLNGAGAPAGLAYLKKSLPETMHRIIKTGNIPALEAVLAADGLLTARNIGRYIELALKSDKHEIYVMLVHRKDELNGYGGGKKTFKL